MRRRTRLIHAGLLLASASVVCSGQTAYPGFTYFGNGGCRAGPNQPYRYYKMSGVTQAGCAAMCRSFPDACVAWMHRPASRCEIFGSGLLNDASMIPSGWGWYKSHDGSSDTITRVDGNTNYRCYTTNKPCADKTRENHCGNRGAPTVDDDECTCQCDDGWKGGSCQQDPCSGKTADSLCNGQGATTVDGAECRCNCQAGYTGANCETDTDECIDKLCSNQGACIDGVNSYTCNCQAGYTDANCETNIDECAGQSCSNHGSCVDGVNTYTCNCDFGYTGDSCSQQTTTETTTTETTTTETTTTSTITGTTTTTVSTATTTTSITSSTTTTLNATELSALNITAADLCRQNMSIVELFSKGFTAGELVDAGCSQSEVKRADPNKKSGNRDAADSKGVGEAVGNASIKTPLGNATRSKDPADVDVDIATDDDDGGLDISSASLVGLVCGLLVVLAIAAVVSLGIKRRRQGERIDRLATLYARPGVASTAPRPAVVMNATYDVVTAETSPTEYATPYESSNGGYEMPTQCPSQQPAADDGYEMPTPTTDTAAATYDDFGDYDEMDL